MRRNIAKSLDTLRVVRDGCTNFYSLVNDDKMRVLETQFRVFSCFALVKGLTVGREIPIITWLGSSILGTTVRLTTDPRSPHRCREPCLYIRKVLITKRGHELGWRLPTQPGKVTLLQGDAYGRCLVHVPRLPSLKR